MTPPVLRPLLIFAPWVGTLLDGRAPQSTIMSGAIAVAAADNLSARRCRVAVYCVVVFFMLRNTLCVSTKSKQTMSSPPSVGANVGVAEFYL